MSTRRAVSPLILAALFSFAVPHTLVRAQTPKAQPAPLRFDIARFEVSGNTLLSQQEIDRAVAPYTGSQKEFGDIQGAVRSLERAYQVRGYAVVQVRVGEQDIKSGIVRLTVIEPRIGAVGVEGNRYFDEANIRQSLPGLKPGAAPNSRQLTRNLQLLAEHPTKQTTVLLKPGARENEVDASVKVVDENPLKFVFTLDNSGTSQTGHYRLGVGVQHSNVFNRDHVVNLQYITNPEDPDKVKVFGAGYRIPFYTLGSSLDLYAGHSNINSGTVQGLFTVSGSGDVFGTRYNIYLDKVGIYEHKVALGFDYRAFQPNIQFGGVSLLPDVTIHPVSVAYSGLWRMATSEAGFQASFSRNIPGGNDGGDTAFKATRAEATPNYKIFRGGAHYTQLFARDWQARAALNGQYTPDALVPGEQFGLGGPDSLRGFDVREVTNDKGYGVNLEVYTPDFGSRVWSPDVKARALVFFDWGTTRRNHIQPGESSGETGSSIGLGFRAAYSKNVVIRVDFANVLDAAGSQSRNDKKVHASIALVL